jgi:hypothetical protein
MKKSTLTLATVVLLVFAACNNKSEPKENEHHDNAPATTDTTASAAPAKEQETPPMDSAAMQKAWESYMTPGDMHKWMASTDGKWSAELTFWMTPDAPPSPPSKATVENKTILGGRYQQQTYKGKMMGMDFEGHGTMAYDNAKKKFISTWIDNMGTGVMYSEGPFDEGSKTISMTGKSMDAASGKELATRSVTKIIDDKTQVMEMFCTQNGKEFKNMEIKLKRM